MKTLKASRHQPEKAADWIEQMIAWNLGCMDADDEEIYIYDEEDYDDVQGYWQDFLRLLKGATAIEIYDVTYETFGISQCIREKYLILNLEYQYFQARVIIKGL